ncbi:MAG TPA: hypothetical protein VHJ34_13620 [Actinomycetota bacterium]|nr:hypothetical protein [Actinomycetota bacterium]
MSKGRRLGRTRRKIVVACVAAAIVSSGTAALATHVDNMYPTANYNHTCVGGGRETKFCKTDSYWLTYFRQISLSDTGKTRIWSVLDVEFSPTDLTIRNEDPPVYSGASETDVIYHYRSDLADHVVGTVWCNDAATSTHCDQHYAAFDSPSPTRSVICHETGHSVGLTHGPAADPPLAIDDASLGCMSNPIDDLGPHNTNMINATY